MEILRAWQNDPTISHRFIIFTTPRARTYLRELQLDQRFLWINAPDSRILRILWQQIVLPWHLKQHRVDAHWGSGFVLPLASQTPMAVTIHDLSFQLFPALHEPVKRYYFPAMIKAAVRKAKVVIAVSQSTRTDLSRLLPESLHKTQVTLLAPRTMPASNPNSPAAAGSPYLICLGTLEPRKNLDRLIAAWLSLPLVERNGIRLVVVGMKGWMINHLLERHNQADNSVEFTGFIDDAILNNLLRNALALVYPSLYEGFGLPVIEAMACGTPVLTSDLGATREVAGDAALLIDPLDSEAIAHALHRLIVDRNLRRSLSEKGLVRAQQFSWQTTARQTLAILEFVATDPACRTPPHNIP